MLAITIKEHLNGVMLVAGVISVTTDVGDHHPGSSNKSDTGKRSDACGRSDIGDH